MKNYLTPSFSTIKLSEDDVMLISTLTAGDDNFKGDTLTPDDYLGGVRWELKGLKV